MDPQQPPLTVTQQAYTSHSEHSSVGPVIAVLAVITILGVIAGMIGRFCSGHPIRGFRQYDFEGWFETKFSSCIDGRINPPPPCPTPPMHPEMVEASSHFPTQAPVETPQEIKETKQLQMRSSRNNTRA